jgi:hypothetical protein
MQPLDLNLSSQPFRNNALLWTAHAIACGSLLTFSVWNVSTYLRETRDVAELKTQIAENDRRGADLDLREKRAEAGAGRHDLKDLSRQAATANQVIMMRALSWTRLFNQLEKVVPYEVKTIAIRPTFGTGTAGASNAGSLEDAVPVEVQGTAQSLEAFLEFERSLLVDPHFDQVEPDRSDIVEGGEISFKMGFLYYAEGRKGAKEIPNLPHVLEAAGEEAASPEEAALVGAGTVEPAGPAAAPPPPPQPAQALGRPKPGAQAPLRPALQAPKGGRR